MFSGAMNWEYCSEMGEIVEKSDFHNPDNIYVLKVNNRNTRKRCEICSKLTIKTPERRQKLLSRILSKS